MDINSGNKLLEKSKSAKVASKFVKAREFFYGEDLYDNSGMVMKAWYNTYTYYGLKSEEFKGFLRSTRRKIGNKMNDLSFWYQTSGFGKDVRQAGRKVVSVAKKVKDTSVKMAKYGGELIKKGIQKTINGVKAVATNSKVVNAARKVSGFFKATGAWIKDTAIKTGKTVKIWATVRPDKDPEYITSIIGRRLRPSDAASYMKSGLRYVVYGTYQGAKGIAGLAGKAVLYQAKGMIKTAYRDRDETVELAKKVAETKAAKKAGNILKGLAQKAKAFAIRTAEGVKRVGINTKDKLTDLKDKAYDGCVYLAQKGSNAFVRVKDRVQDYFRETGREDAFGRMQIREYLQTRKHGKDYAEKMSRFRREVLGQKDIKTKLQLRENKLRIYRNAQAMAKGQTGDIELAEMNSEGKFVRENIGDGMLQSINKYDLGNALIKDEKELKAEADKKKAEADKRKSGKKLNLSELTIIDKEKTQEEKDKKFLKEQGKDPENIPMAVPSGNKIIGLSSKLVKEIKDNAKKVGDAMSEVGKKAKSINEGIDSIGKGIDQVINPQQSLVKQALEKTGADKYLKSLQGQKKKIMSQLQEPVKAVKDVTDVISDDINALTKGVKNSNEAVKLANKNLSFVEKMGKKAGVKIPVAGFGKCLENIMNIKDDKEREKNISALVANGLSQAGTIVKTYAGENNFTKLSTVLNDIKLTDLVSETIKARQQKDNIKLAQAYLKDMKGAMNLMDKLLKTANKKNALLNSAAMFAPIVTILDTVDKFNSLTKANQKINQLTEADKSLNFTDKNVIEHMSLTANDLIKQNMDKQKGAIADGVISGALSVMGGDGLSKITSALKYASPTILLMHQLKKKTDHELMMQDAFGSIANYKRYRDQYNLTDREIQDEILKMTQTKSVKEYADRVRLESAMHIYSRNRQAEQYGIKNGATKLKEAANLKGKSVKEIYKELGGTMDYDRLSGKTSKDLYNERLERQKQETLQRKENRRKSREEELAKRTKEYNEKNIAKRGKVK